jgi:hypothetical protein
MYASRERMEVNMMVDKEKESVAYPVDIDRNVADRRGWLGRLASMTSCHIWTRKDNTMVDMFKL